jgi:hypothetical protein
MGRQPPGAPAFALLRDTLAQALTAEGSPAGPFLTAVTFVGSPGRAGHPPGQPPSIPLASARRHDDSPHYANPGRARSRHRGIRHASGIRSRRRACLVRASQATELLATDP